MKNDKQKWIVTVALDDNPDFLIVPLPDELMTQLGWKIGDEIKLEIVGNKIVATKPG